MPDAKSARFPFVTDRPVDPFAFARPQRRCVSSSSDDFVVLIEYDHPASNPQSAVSSTAQRVLTFESIVVPFGRVRILQCDGRRMVGIRRADERDSE